MHSEETLMMDGLQEEPVSGHVVQGYLLGDLLGKGAHGKVYRATKPDTPGATYAIKIIDIQGQPQSFVERIVRECAISTRLRHSGIIAVHEAGYWGSFIFIVMDVAVGVACDHYSKGTLGWELATAVVRQVAMALDYAYATTHIIHRDIKPANIVVELVGSNLRSVKVVDFGLSRTVDDEGVGLTMTGMILGTPFYMSPEQARGERDLTFHTDLYALGATLFFLVSGKPPFSKGTPVEILVQHCQEPAPDLRSVAPQCPPELARIVARCLAKSTAERYPNYGEFIAALEQFVSDDPFAAVDGAGPSVSAPSSRYTHRVIPGESSGSDRRGGSSSGTGTRSDRRGGSSSGTGSRSDRRGQSSSVGSDALGDLFRVKLHETTSTFRKPTGSIVNPAHLPADPPTAVRRVTPKFPTIAQMAAATQQAVEHKPAEQKPAEADAAAAPAASAAPAQPLTSRLRAKFPTLADPTVSAQPTTAAAATTPTLEAAARESAAPESAAPAAADPEAAPKPDTRPIMRAPPRPAAGPKPPSLANGTLIDSLYTVVGPIGAGAMGEVYAVHDPVTQREIALKMLSHDDMRRPGMVRRFQGECSALATVNHPAFPFFAGKGTFQGRDFLLMERVQGIDLKAWMKQYGAMSETDGLMVVGQLAEAMDRAYTTCGMVHRDIKPANLMLSKAGEGDMLKLIDFGVSTYIDYGDFEDFSAREYVYIDDDSKGKAVGTPAYMSPEQCVGAPPSPLMDIYAIGCTFFNLLTGKTPYQANNAAMMMMRHIQEQPPVFDAELEVSSGTAYLLKRCMAKSPRDRFQNYKQVIDAVDSARFSMSTRIRRRPN